MKILIRALLLSIPGLDYVDPLSLQLSAEEILTSHTSAACKGFSGWEAIGSHWKPLEAVEEEP